MKTKNTYKVTVSEVKEYEVKAESQEEAEERAIQLFSECYENVVAESVELKEQDHA